ncbi:uncharacterized protein K452DRAFT_341044 [Aplosporella prunicola CBS 121167]|uniref:NmrA-like domain-containing protein n=1 Tax=Aplosporella prunicola CBS 121167 TaxID=1176127 RepID=A0A6A6BRJ2_9PEZI|nr:uncharacterized protein K452DRAFT_341044 [Aplosporella prunicola CBS 121167]KAF2146398.1 hypothetical protein K452DRAFT_341044 [Aplosporella prunicola CBS 121167]
MVNVAIAGGTGAVGRTILEVLKDHPQHTPIILTRKAPEEVQEQFGVKAVQLDYDDVESLKQELEAHSIHTVISTFGNRGDSFKISQVNLIKAAGQSSETKRFVPSSFGAPYPEGSDAILPPLKYYFASIDELKKTNLQWTVVLNGIFLDYYAMPHIKTYLNPNSLALDIASRIAAIPGDGNVPITFTYTFDVARFVVAMLDLEEWPEETRLAGDRVTFNEFVALAEEVTGSNFTVQYDGMEKLKRFEVTELPSHVPLYESFPKQRLQWFLAIFETWMADGTSNVAPELNQRFPHIKPLTVRAMLEQHWKGKGKGN